MKRRCWVPVITFGGARCTRPASGSDGLCKTHQQTGPGGAASYAEKEVRWRLNYEQRFIVALREGAARIRDGAVLRGAFPQMRGFGIGVDLALERFYEECRHLAPSPHSSFPLDASGELLAETVDAVVVLIQSRLALYLRMFAPGRADELERAEATHATADELTGHQRKLG